MNKKDNNINAKREALQKLIAVGGDCTKLDCNFCLTCPLDACRTRPDGSFMSCLGAAENAYGRDALPEEAFLKLAIELLSQLEVESMLRGSDVED